MNRLFVSRDRGRLKCAHAHVLQSIRRHGTGNPKFLKRETYQSALAALGIWEILAPIVIPFLRQAIGVLVEYLIQMIDRLNPSEPSENPATFRANALATLATEAHARWPQKGFA